MCVFAWRINAGGGLGFEGFSGVAKGISEEGIAVMMVYIGCCIGWDWSPSPGKSIPKNY